MVLSDCGSGLVVVIDVPLVGNLYRNAKELGTIVLFKHILYMQLFMQHTVQYSYISPFTCRPALPSMRQCIVYRSVKNFIALSNIYIQWAFLWI